MFFVAIGACDESMVRSPLTFSSNNTRDRSSSTDFHSSTYQQLLAVRVGLILSSAVDAPAKSSKTCCARTNEEKQCLPV